MLRSTAAVVFYVPYEKHHKQKKHRKRYSILVVRLNKNGFLTYSRPCDHCIHILKTIGIDKIYYSDGAGNIIIEKVKYMGKQHVCAGSKFLERKADD